MDCYHHGADQLRSTPEDSSYDCHSTPEDSSYNSDQEDHKDMHGYDYEPEMVSVKVNVNEEY